MSIITIGRRLKPFVPPILFNSLKDYYLRNRDYSSISGGIWEDIGELQIEFLKSAGLDTSDEFLDIGCGSLRAGVHFVEYLNDGHYYGVDKDQWRLDIGRNKALPQYGLDDAKVHLHKFGDFGFHRLDTTFDIALAQSVFTHLPWNQIGRCLVNVDRVLGPNGEFYTTFFETDECFRIEPKTHQPGGVTTYPDRDPYHYHTSVFENLCEGLDLSIEYIGDWNHPRNQKMLRFYRD